MTFPGENWESVTPESQGVDSGRLAAAVEFLRQNSGRDGVDQLVIVRNGRIIWSGPKVDEVHGIWSCTKSFTSTVLGLLVDDGKCSVDTLARKYVPELAETYPDVRLRHFTTMTSGYRAVGDETRGSYTHGPSRTPFQPDPEPLFTPPGSHYAYWDSAMNQFGNVLTRIAGEPMESVFRRRIAEPIGMDPRQWKWGDFGEVDGIVVNGGAGNAGNHVQISAREMARLGHLFLNRGACNGRQLISAAWIEAATSVQVPASTPLGNARLSGSRGGGVYGFNWWVNGLGADGARKWPGAPDDAFAASGFNNNDMFVLPNWQMVVVRLGLDEGELPITDATYGRFLEQVGAAIVEPVVDGEHRVWYPVSIRFSGPSARETDDAPNPFLDFRLQVELTAPSGGTYNVPGYFDGDGNGGGEGNVWRARFTPDEPGNWRYRASFRQGPRIAVSNDSQAGEPAAFDGSEGAFEVASRDADAPGFHQWGRLEYVGGHYLKFRDGPYWLRGGTDSPENLLAYAGFDDTPPSHTYAAHADDWQPGDPDWGGGRGRAILGALNYLAKQHVNSIYFLTMNVGGDGGDVWPWVRIDHPEGDPANDNLHFDVSKLRQWETVFAHAERLGIFLHVVFNEAEAANKRELDDGELGTERKLYYREIIARFGHHLALEWNLCEEYNLQFDFGPERVRAFADYLGSVDPVDHPVTVHSAGDPLEMLRFTFGDERFSLTSIQLNQRPIHEVTEAIRRATREAGRPLPISLDEFTLDRGQARSAIPVDDAEGHRREKLWPTYFSGGMIEFILDDLLETESFKTVEREKLWTYTWYARRFMEQHLPFWEMEPADALMEGEATMPVRIGRGRTTPLGARVFAKRGEIYAVYLPTASETGTLDLLQAEGEFRMRWYDPRTGEFVGPARAVRGGERLALGPPPRNPADDWVVLVDRP